MWLSSGGAAAAVVVMLCELREGMHEGQEFGAVGFSMFEKKTTENA